jgi:hypothetical protein
MWAEMKTDRAEYGRAINMDCKWITILLQRIIYFKAFSVSDEPLGFIAILLVDEWAV